MNLCRRKPDCSLLAAFTTSAKQAGGGQRNSSKQTLSLGVKRAILAGKNHYWRTEDVLGNTLKVTNSVRSLPTAPHNSTALNPLGLLSDPTLAPLLSARTGRWLHGCRLARVQPNTARCHLPCRAVGLLVAPRLPGGCLRAAPSPVPPPPPRPSSGSRGCPLPEGAG